jgi:hypothetical protein
MGEAAAAPRPAWAGGRRTWPPFLSFPRSPGAAAVCFSSREHDAKQRNSYGCTVLRSLLLSFLPSPVLRPFLFWLATGREIYRGRVELVLAGQELNWQYYRLTLQ